MQNDARPQEANADDDALNDAGDLRLRIICNRQYRERRSHADKPKRAHPVGLLCSSRLRPSAPPMSIAAPIRSTISVQPSMGPHHRLKHLMPRRLMDLADPLRALAPPVRALAPRGRAARGQMRWR